jgi:hypothetical protein
MSFPGSCKMISHSKLYVDDLWFTCRFPFMFEDGKKIQHISVNSCPSQTNQIVFNLRRLTSFACSMIAIFHSNTILIHVFKLNLWYNIVWKVAFAVFLAYLCGLCICVQMLLTKACTQCLKRSCSSCFTCSDW